MQIENTEEIEQIQAQLARLRQISNKHSSEKLKQRIEQMELLLDDLEESLGQSVQMGAARPIGGRWSTELCSPLPDHLLSADVVYAADVVNAKASNCPSCGGKLRWKGEVVIKVLDYRAGRFHVIRHVRPKVSCRRCRSTTQVAGRDNAPGTESNFEQVAPGSGMLAHVLMSKYVDHQPLARQTEIYAREGVALERSTLANWVGHSVALLEPLICLLRKEIRTSPQVYADNVRVRILNSDTGKTNTAQLFAYVRDDGPDGDYAPPVATYSYLPGNEVDLGVNILASFAAILADIYSVFAPVSTARQRWKAATPIPGWASVRRKFQNACVAGKCSVAREALERIDAILEIERRIGILPPNERDRTRQERSQPAANDLFAWMTITLPKLSQCSDAAAAIRYALTHSQGLLHDLADGRLATDSLLASRALRVVALAPNNSHFASSDAGGERAASIYSLIETARLNDLDPQAYLADVIARICNHPAPDLADLLPYNWEPSPQS